MPPRRVWEIWHNIRHLTLQPLPSLLLQIKFLKTKEGTAMVQMGDSVAVERCVQHLNNIPVGTGGKIQIAFSKQNFLSEVINPFLLPDHSPSFKEYTGSKNNRFLSPAQASKNRIQPPSKVGFGLTEIPTKR